MMASPQGDGQDSTRLRVNQLSLQTIFFATFLAACLSRVAARYGIGVLAIVGWCALAGTIVGVIVASFVALVDMVLSSASRRPPSWSLARSRFVRCVLTGTLGGLIMQGLAAAGLFSLTNQPPTKIFSSWSDGMAMLSQTFREPLVWRFLMVSPALLGALSTSTARAFANRTSTVGQSIAPTGCLLATMFGLTPLALLIIWIAIWNLFFRPPGPPPPPPPGHENMLGLLPLAVPFWCAIAAAIGGASGVASATLLTLLSHAERNRLTREVLWYAAILAAVLITEVAIHGWTGKALKLWTRKWRDDSLANKLCVRHRSRAQSI